MTDIVFLVDDILPSGELVTATDRLRSISDNWQPNVYEDNKRYYLELAGDRVKFARLRDVTSYDSNKRYFYFIPMNDWHCTAQQYFFLLDKNIQLEFARNRVGFYFCQDFEMYPNMNINFLGNYLGWVRLCRDAHSFSQIPLYFAMAAGMEKKQKFAIRRAFHGDINLVHSPLLVSYSVGQLRRRTAAAGVNLDELVAGFIAEYLDAPKTKLYASLTRDQKYHRVTMMHALRSLDLLSKGHVSNLMPRPYTSDAAAAVKSDYAERVVSDMTLAGDLPLMRADDVEASERERDAFIVEGLGGVLPLDVMRSSWYDLVQETGTRYDVLDTVVDMAVVTEKTVKSLLFARPYAVNGGPECLKVIRRWGFETCDFLFDERYDSLEHFMDRQAVIADDMVRHAQDLTLVERAVRENRDSMLRNSARALNFPAADVLADAILRPWE